MKSIQISYPLPSKHLSPSRLSIVRAFVALRADPQRVAHSIVFTIARDLGYTIDRNNSNDFVRRVIRDYLADLASRNIPFTLECEDK